MKTLFFGTLMGIVTFSSYGMVIQQSSSPTPSSREDKTTNLWISVYGTYFRDPNERILLVEYIGTRIAINRIYGKYHQSYARCYEKRGMSSECLLNRCLRISDVYNEFHAYHNDLVLELEMASLNSGYSVIKDKAYTFLKRLVPVAPSNLDHIPRIFGPEAQEQYQAYQRSAELIIHFLENQK